MQRKRTNLLNTGSILLVFLFAASQLEAGFPIINEDTVGTGSYYSDDDGPAAWLTKIGADWMSHVPDSTELVDISMPGTHDSGALLGGIKTQAQSWSITEQLNAGIRYLDIRTRLKGNSNQSDLQVFHGPKDMQMHLGDVFNAVSGFLQKHPSETILIDLRINERPISGDYYRKNYQDNTPDDDSDDYDNYLARAQAIIQGLLSNHQSYYQSATLNVSSTLEDSRGKFIILRGDALFSEGTKFNRNHGDQGIWSVQNKYELVPIAGKNREYTGAETSLAGKDELIREFIEHANSSPSEFVMNRVAATGQSITWGPARAAKRFNKTAYNAIGKNPYAPAGIIVVDFPGESLAYRIIKTNFDAPQIKAASRSEGKAYFFNGEQGKYFRYTSGVGVDSGYPLSIKRNWSVGDRKVIAAVMHDNGKGYLFLEGGYYSRSGGANQSDYPALITDKSWPGLEKYRNEIKAAVNWGNGKIYFFTDPGPLKPGRYVRYDVKTNRVDQEAKPVKGAWDKLGEANDDISGALNYWNGKAYFFTEGGNYYRWDIEKNRVDNGYPRPLSKASKWNVFNAVGDVTAAYRFK